MDHCNAEFHLFFSKIILYLNKAGIRVKPLHSSHSHVYCKTTPQCSSTLFSWLGMMHLTKFGWVLCSVVISLARDSLYSCPTVRNIPFLVFEALGIELSDILAIVSRPTTLSAETENTVVFSNVLKLMFVFFACYSQIACVIYYLGP